MGSRVVRNPYWVDPNHIKICNEKSGCNYEESSNMCKESGGNLAIIVNTNESKLATSAFQRNQITNSGTGFLYWIGLTDIVSIAIFLNYKE